MHTMRRLIGRDTTQEPVKNKKAELPIQASNNSNSTIISIQSLRKLERNAFYGPHTGLRPEIPKQAFPFWFKRHSSASWSQTSFKRNYHYEKELSHDLVEFCVVPICKCGRWNGFLKHSTFSILQVPSR